jgi:hypothetical protein
MPDTADYGLPETEALQPVLHAWRGTISVEEYLKHVLLSRSGIPGWLCIINPRTLTSELHTLDGIHRVGAVLAIPGTPIEITLSDIMTE